MNDGDAFDAAWFRLRDSLLVDEKLSRLILRGLADFFGENFNPRAAASIREITKAAFEPKPDDDGYGESKDSEEPSSCGADCRWCACVGKCNE